MADKSNEKKTLLNLLDRIADAQESIAEAENALPEVTASDNGDVLTVVEGEWAKAAPAPSGGALIVHSVDGTLDKTWQEINDADYAIIVDTGNPDRKVTVLVWMVYDYDTDDYRVYTDSETYYKATSTTGYPERHII